MLMVATDDRRTALPPQSARNALRANKHTSWNEADRAGRCGWRYDGFSTFSTLICITNRLPASGWL